ncbi:hypothetical protein D3C87_2062570 [compost metagenome]
MVVPAESQVPIQEGDGGRCVGNELLEQILLLGERTLGILPLGHVAEHGEHELSLPNPSGDGAQGQLQAELASRFMLAG